MMMNKSKSTKTLVRNPFLKLDDLKPQDGLAVDTFKWMLYNGCNKQKQDALDWYREAWGVDSTRYVDVPSKVSYKEIKKSLLDNTTYKYYNLKTGKFGLIHTNDQLITVTSYGYYIGAKSINWRLGDRIILGVYYEN